jgi:hypothetical protein
MAFRRADLHLAVGTIGGGNLRIWLYSNSNADSLSTLLAPGFITKASGSGIEIGDIVMVRSGGTDPGVELRVTSISSDNASLAPSESAGIVTATGSTEPRVLSDRFGERVNVLDYGCGTDIPSEVTAGFAAAQAEVARRGGGCVYVPDGVYRVDLDDSDYSNDPETRRLAPIAVRNSNEHWLGASKTKTIIKLAREDSARSVMHIQNVPVGDDEIGIEGGSLRRITLDGNFVDGELSPSEGSAIIYAGGLQDFVFEDFLLKNGGSYGLGLQDGPNIRVKVINGDIYNVQEDGVDNKDQGAASFGCVIDGLVVRSWGRKTDNANPYAAIDLLGRGWQVSRVHVLGFGGEGSPAAAIRLKQGSEVSARGYSPEHTSVSQFLVLQDAHSERLVMGVLCSAPYVSLSHGHMLGLTNFGVAIDQPYCTVSGVYTTAHEPVADIFGFVARDRESTTSEFLGADYTTFIACTAYGFGTGFRSARTGVSMAHCIANTCDLGFEVDGADALNNQLFDCTPIGCDTPYFINNHGGHRVFNCPGIASPGLLTPPQSGVLSHARWVAPSQHDFICGYDGGNTSGTSVLRLNLDDPDHPIIVRIDGQYRAVKRDTNVGGKRFLYVDT